MTLVQPDVPRLRRYLNDVEHDLCVVLVIAPDNGGYAYAVCEANTGEVIAWDGWYGDEGRETNVVPLADLEWDEWDDMASKFLIRNKTRWADGRMDYLLMPTFSPARAAGRLLHATEDQDTSELANRNMHRGRVVAYLPIVDKDVFDAARAGKITG